MVSSPFSITRYTCMVYFVRIFSIEITSKTVAKAFWVGEVEMELRRLG